MAIVFTNLGASANPDIVDALNSATYSGTSWTPPTTGIIISFVTNRIANPGNVPTMEGNAINWIQLATASNDPGASHRITAFGANAAGAVTGATGVRFAGETQISCDASFFQAEGVDISGGLLAAVVQAPISSGTSTSGTLTFLAAGHADNRAVCAWAHQAQEITSPDGGWVEIDDVSGTGPARGFETQWKDDGVASNTTTWVTSSAFIALGLELKAEVGGETGQPAVKRMGGVPHAHSNSSQGGRVW